MKLNERQRYALLWLDDGTQPGEALYPKQDSAAGYAYALGMAMEAAGLLHHQEGGRSKRHGASQGAANALVALKRRGLARNSTPGGEAFQAVRWGITDEGHIEAKRLREQRETM